MLSTSIQQELTWACNYCGRDRKLSFRSNALLFLKHLHQHLLSRRVNQTYLSTLIGIVLPCAQPGDKPENADRIAIDMGQIFSNNRLELCEWETFLVCQLGCIVGGISLDTSRPPQSHTLPAFETFSKEEALWTAELLQAATAQNEPLLNWLRNVHILATAGSNAPERTRVASCYLAQLFSEIDSLPCVRVPLHCRNLAAVLGVKLNTDAEACITALQHLHNLNVRQPEPFFQWLGELQRAQKDLRDDWSEVAALHVFTRDPVPGFTQISDLVLVLDPVKKAKDSGDQVDSSGNENPSAFYEAMSLVQANTSMRLVSSTHNIQYLSFCQFFRRCGCETVPSIQTVLVGFNKMAKNKNNFYDPGTGVPTALVRKVVQDQFLKLYVLLELLLYRQSRLHAAPDEASKHRIGTEPLTPEPRRKQLEEDYRWRFSLDTFVAADNTAILANNCDFKQLPLLLANGLMAMEQQRHLCIACMQQPLCQAMAMMPAGDTAISCLNPSMVIKCPVSKLYTCKSVHMY